MRRQSGFTLMELMIIITIIAVLAAIAVPNFLGWLPKYRLKSAVDELFSNLNLAKMTAVRNGQDCKVLFDADGYTIECLSKTVNLDGYGSGITFKNPDGSSGFPAFITFNSRGLSNDGIVRLTNEARTGYFQVQVQSSGVIHIMKWNGSSFI